MSARISRGSPTETPKTSAHDKKIETRVDNVMKSVDSILNTRELKLYALLRTEDPRYQKVKASPHFYSMYAKYATEYNKGWHKSEKYQNQLQFRELVMDRLAKDSLGEYYVEYKNKIKKGITNGAMAAWIHEKLNETCRLAMQARSSSQPVLPVSARNTASSSKANTTNQLGMPDGTPTAPHPPVWRTSDGTPQAAYLPTEISTTATPQLTPRQQKANKYVDFVMKSTAGILDTQEVKLFVLIKLTDHRYSDIHFHRKSVEFKYSDDYNNKYETFYPEWKRKFNKANDFFFAEEFEKRFLDRLAKDSLGAYYDEYINKIKKGITDGDMAAWIHEKLNETCRLAMQARSSSQPVLPVSARNTASSSKANTTNQLGMPDGTPTAPHPQVWRTSDSTPKEPYAPSSARSSQFSYPKPPVAVQSQFLQPQPLQPQPLQPNTHMTANPVAHPGIPATLPQFHNRQFPGPATATGSFSQAGQTPVNSAALSVRATFSMLGTVADLERLGFNRDGYVVLLQYLVAGWVPSQNHTESLRQFNEKFFPTIQWISEKCATLSPAQQRLWTDNVAVYLVGSVYELDLAEQLENQLRQGMDRTAIASWLQTAIPR